MTAEPVPILHLDGFDGPMDLLLELARKDRVDLGRISILALVEQYLAAVGGAQAVRLDLAADWLVMAAWLTWLKSRLLLPPEADSAAEAEEAAEILLARLGELQAVRGLAGFLRGRPQLGTDTFGRGAPETLVAVDRSALLADTPSLLRAYAGARRRAAAGKPYTPKRPPFWSVADALARLGRLLGRARGWTALESFLPSLPAEALARRAALASTLLAGLELARTGQADLRQDVAFGPIALRAAAA